MPSQMECGQCAPGAAQGRSEGDDSLDHKLRAERERFAAAYRLLTTGRRAWLSDHWAEGATTPFGLSLLVALQAIETRLPGAGERFVTELAGIRYVPSRDDEGAWKAGFEQLVQKLGEMLVARTPVRGGVARRDNVIPRAAQPGYRREARGCSRHADPAVALRGQMSRLHRIPGPAQRQSTAVAGAWSAGKRPRHAGRDDPAAGQRA